MKLIRIEEQIKTLLSEHTMFSADEILQEDKLIDLGIDVSKVSKIIDTVEELFGIELDRSEVSASMNVHAFVELVDSQMYYT